MQADDPDHKERLELDPEGASSACGVAVWLAYGRSHEVPHDEARNTAERPTGLPMTRRH